MTSTIADIVQLPLNREDFRLGLEFALEEKETNRRQQFRIKRVLRNDRVFNRIFDRLAPRIANDLAMDASADSFLDWFLENWDEIFKIIMQIVGMF